MKFPLRATEESPAMFENKFIDALSRTHWVFVPMLYVPAAAIMIWYSFKYISAPWVTTTALIVGGYLTWTLTEYWIHRTIFHWTPDTSWGPRMHFFVHGVHHDWPNDPFRLVMPPSVSIILFFLFLGLFRFAWGDYVWAFQGGFTIGYVIYDLLHYYTHHSKPTSKLMTSLQRHHLSHHFHPKYEDRRFSISFPLWDHVFATHAADKRSSREIVGAEE